MRSAMGMAHCPLCDQRYDAEGYKTVCGTCYEQGMVDGSDVQRELMRALFIVHNSNRKWLEDDVQVIANSAAWAKLAIDVLPRMESGCLKQLLKQVLKAIE